MSRLACLWNRARVAIAAPLRLRERRIVFLMAVTLALVAAWPTLQGLREARLHHAELTGQSIFQLDDAEVYLSYVDQARRGHWLFINDFTSEPSYPFLSPVWLAIGLFARVTGLTPLAAISLARVLLAFLLPWACHWCARQFLRDPVERLSAVALIAFGAGQGAIALALGSDHFSLPIDFWVMEAAPVLSAMTTPHFVAGWILLALIYGLIFRAFRDGRRRDAAAAGLLSAFLILFHPYHAPVIFFVAGVTLVALSLVDFRRLRQRITALAVMAVLVAPAAAYHWWQLQPARNGRHALAGNLCWTPSLPNVLFGLGAFVPLAVYGAIVWRRRAPADDRLSRLFLICWAVAQFAMAYAPTMVQRRFLQGLLLPLGLLAGIGLVALVRWLRVQQGGIRLVRLTAFVIAAALAFLLTPATLLRENSSILAAGQPVNVFLTADESAMFRWLRTNVPEGSVVLSAPVTGSLLVPRTALRSYIGHWSQTIDLERKSDEAQRFFGRTRPDGALLSFLQGERISYVYFGPRERGYGGALADLPFLEELHREGQVIVYRVRP